MSKARIVIVEDEPDIAEIISYNLVREGFTVEHAENGTEGLALIKHSKPDLAILDIMLPGMDGVEICRNIRQHPELSETPVIMLSAKDDEIDVVLGLRMGADDYMCKPFSPRELLERVKAILRRKQQGPDNNNAKKLIHGPISVDQERHEVKLHAQKIDLTATEFKILSCLAERPGRVFNRDDLLTRVMGDDAIVIDRTIDVHIRSIRKKFGEQRDLIETVRGVGYRFRDLDAL